MVRKEMGVEFVGVDYKQMGLIATLELQEVIISSAVAHSQALTRIAFPSVGRKYHCVATVPSKRNHRLAAADRPVELDRLEH